MSIQRYVAGFAPNIQRYVAGFAPNMAPALLKYAEGDAVLFSDHEAELHNLLSTLADIRTALGVGGKPMLNELAAEIGRIKRERDEAVEALRRWQELFCDSDMRPEDECHECYDFADAVLAKIGGQG